MKIIDSPSCTLATMKDERWRVLVEAPLRVDFGGTIDIPVVARALAGQRPCTFNIAAAPGVALEIGRCPSEMNVLSVFGRPDVALPPDFVPPPGSRHRLVFGTLAAMGVDGIHVRLLPGARAGTGLGGSGAVTCALVFGLLALRRQEVELDDASRLRCAILAREIECGLGESITGLQDQLAAAFGGMNLWQWRWDEAGGPVTRHRLIPGDSFHEHLLVCELLASRASSTATARFLQSLEVPALQEVWSQLNSLTARFADCVVGRDWPEACHLSSIALTLRQVLLGRDDLLSHPVIERALAMGCAAGFGGGNVEGSLWAMGPSSAIRLLRSEIHQGGNSHARVLRIKPAERGARVVELQPCESRWASLRSCSAKLVNREGTEFG